MKRIIDGGSLVRCFYCGTTTGIGNHNGRGGHLFVALAAVLGHNYATLTDVGKAHFRLAWAIKNGSAA